MHGGNGIVRLDGKVAEQVVAIWFCSVSTTSYVLLGGGMGGECRVFNRKHIATAPDVSRFRSRVGVPMGAVCNAPANNVCSTISKCELGARSNLAHSMNLLRSSLRSLLLRQGRKPKHVVPLLRCRNAGIRPCLPHTRRESALSRTGSYKRDRRSRSGAYRTPVC